MNRITPTVLATLCLAVCCCAPGCRSRNGGDPGTDEGTAITRTALRGPVTLTVQSDRSQATIAERFTLTVTVEADDEIDVTLPEFGDALGELTIRDFRSSGPKPIEGGRRRWQHHYEVDAEVSGTYEVRPITVTFVDRREGSPGPPRPTTTASTSQPVRRVSTEPFELEVSSLLEGEFDPTSFRDVKAPAELPKPPPRWPYWVVGIAGGLLAVALAIYLLMRRRRRRGEEVVQIPPHEWALEQLQALLDEDLVGQDRIQEFYYRLNAIVRQYIELRFELMAPEMTTEEFLEALRNSYLLTPGRKELLERFMTACDMVKYARYQPGSAEVDEVVTAARNFIRQTIPGRANVDLEPGDETTTEESAA